MAWQSIGTVTVSPTTTEAVVGPIEVPTYGGVELKIRQTSSTPFRWGFGLLSFKSGNGYELGTIKVWPRTTFSHYKLGAGLGVVSNSGILVFEPRSFNLRWVLAGFSLSLQVLADIASDLPSDRVLSDGFSNGSDLIPLVLSGSSGRLSF